MGKSELIGMLGLAVGVIGLIAQLGAPNCPKCGTKLIIVNNYCVKCQYSWKSNNR